MCIRDSPGAGLSGGRGDRRAACAEPDAGVGGRQPPGRIRRGGPAVSYTHLRAHETVLDIVCRLLLEKKKKKIHKKKKKKKDTCRIHTKHTTGTNI